jgi:hypothetical protein
MHSSVVSNCRPHFLRTGIDEKLFVDGSHRATRYLGKTSLSKMSTGRYSATVGLALSLAQYLAAAD